MNNTTQKHILTALSVLEKEINENYKVGNNHKYEVILQMAKNSSDHSTQIYIDKVELLLSEKVSVMQNSNRLNL